MVDKKSFDEVCECYRSIFDGWENLSLAERRDRINRFRAGL